MIIRKIRNNDGSIDKITATSYDNYDVNISNNYKLIKYTKSRKTFKDTIFGTDIGANSGGFINVMVTSSLIAIVSVAVMYLTFRI